MKTASTFFPAPIREAVTRNIAQNPVASAERDRLVSEAAPWLALDEDALWSRVFGPTLPRSWMVWSNGHCPACKKPVVMYEWVIDALRSPWKLACPRCGDRFPKNDFGAFYRSGLAPSGVFDPARADRSLLFHSEHPDPADPLHRFGVDDGNGYVDGEKKWRFIAAYLIYGDWKQFIVAGIRSLAAAFVVTGDRAYSRRALVLLDRLADVFPGFDFVSQGEVYEVKGNHGYVSVWHDANMEHADLIVAYDQVFDALHDDSDLHAFVFEKARKHGLIKRSANDIQRNIEDRLFRDAIRRRDKIHTNFPGMHTLVITMRAVLDWPDCREEIYGYWVDLLRRTTAVDGVTGEKGLPSYSRVTLRWMANAMSLFVVADPGFVGTMLRRVPTFARTFRFHLDTWCCDHAFYPNIGDGTWFGAGSKHYLGLAEVTNNQTKLQMLKTPGARPSMDRLLYEVAEATGDADLHRVLVRANGGEVAGSVFDLTLIDAPAVDAKIRSIIQTHGAAIHLGSINLTDWHLAIHRGGAPGRERAIWMDYDSGGYHSHQDALNVGLFAHGMDLMPDAGYPAVQFGGWNTPKARWYLHAAAHNTVVVDGQTQRAGFHVPIAGQTQLWTQAPTARCVCVSAPAVYGIREYARTLLMVDIDESDFYVVDLFHVDGGSDHAKFMHSNFSTMTTHGLTLNPCEDFGHGTLLRNFRRDENPGGGSPNGWAVDWAIEDRFGLLPSPVDLHLRYSDLTIGAEACPHEGWYVQGSMATSVNEQWVPRLMVRRRAKDPGPLKSTFVGVVEPYAGRRKLRSIRRVWPQPDQPGAASNPGAAMEIELADGSHDMIVLGIQGDAGARGVVVHGAGAVIRFDAQGRVTRLVTLRAYSLRAADLHLQCEAYTVSLELSFEYGSGGPRVRVHTQDLSERNGIEVLTINGVSLLDQL